MTTEIDHKEVGKRLQSFREIRGLTRAVLALKLNITEVELEEIEDGKRQLTKDDLEILRVTFSLDPAWLFGGQDS